MLTRLQNVGSNRFAHSPLQQHFSQGLVSFSDLWTRYFPWSLYAYFNCNPQSLNWRLPFQFYRGYRTVFNCLNFTQQQLSWFHCSQYPMESEESEHAPKRRKYEGKESVKADSRSSSPASSRSSGECSPRRSSEETSDSIHKGRESKTRKIITETLRRNWEDFSYYYDTKLENQEEPSIESLEQKHITFSVMSYNILSQDLLEDNIYLYRHCRYSILNWAYRLLNILKEIQELNADILCLQEVQDNHYRKQIKPRLEEMGYQCEYKMRTGSKPDGCAICFKRSKFTLVEAKPVEFYRRSIQLLDRDNVGLITLLRPIVQCDTPSNICVANTHLLYNPRRGDIKLTQLAILLAEMNRMACQEDGTYCPVILCGDFNSAPFSPLYDFIVEGRLNYYGLAIGRVSGQESPRRGQRELPVPIWPKKLGISQNCQYETDQQPASEDTKAEPSAESDDESSEESDEELSPDTERLLSQLRHSFWLSSVYSHYLSGTDEPEVTTCHSKTSLTVDYIFYSSARNIYVQPAETTEYAVRMEQWRTTWEQVKLQHQEWTPVPPAAVREPRSPHNPQAVVEQQWNVWKDSFKGEKNDEMGPAEGLTKWGQNQETENNMNEFNKDQHIAASQQDQPKHPEDSAAETTVEPQSSSTAQIMKEKCSYSEKLAEKKDAGNSKFKFKEEQYTGTSLQDHTKPQENSASTETMLESHSLSIARKMEEQSSHLEGTAEEHKNDDAQNEEKLNEQEKYEEAWRLYNEEYERKWRKYEKDLNTWRLYKEEKAAYDFQMEQWRTAQQQEGSLVAETPVGDYDVSSHPQKMEEEWSSWESHAKEHWNNDAKNTNHKSLKLIGRLSLLTERDLWKVDGLPNERNSSDHIPLLAKFRLDL